MEISDENEIHLNKKYSFSNDDLIHVKNKDNSLNQSLNSINSEPKLNIINNNIDNQIDDSNEINNKNKIKNRYISIDSKNYFLEEEDEYIKELQSRLKSLCQKNIESIKKEEALCQQMNKNLFEKLFSQKKGNYFNICEKIADKIYKSESELLKGDKMESYLNYFFNKRVKYKYGDTIIIDYQFICNCGPLLCFIYKNLKKRKLKDSKSLINAINEIKEKKIDVLNDFYIDCDQKDLKPEHVNKFEYFKIIKNKYTISPELIFILNLFLLVTKIEIEFNFQEKLLRQNDVYFFFIVFLNLTYLVKDVKYLKLNLINTNIQNGIYGIYSQKLLSESNNNIYYKKNNIILEPYTYNEKWNFENEFILDNYKLLRESKCKKMIEGIKKNKLDYDEFAILESNEFNGTDIKKSNFKNRNSNIEINNFYIMDIDKEEYDLTKKRNSVANHKSNLEYFKKKVNEYTNIFELIYFTFFCLDNFPNLEEIGIILNENFDYECQSYFRNELNLNIGNFHLLNIIYKNLLFMKRLNFEINSFDLITFIKLLQIIYNNNNLTSLKVSLFSSDSSYFPPAIYKVFKQNRENKLMKKKINNNKNLDFRIEDIFFKSIFPHHTKYLKYFFEILKNKKLKTFGINLSIPSQIIKDEKYLMVFIKFILNILLLYLGESVSKAQELIILCPNMVINGNNLLIFDKFLQNLNNNKIISNLNIQIKFYNIINIHKLISEKLEILKIGDLDFLSFKCLVNNITKYKFCKNSNLNSISISLNRTIREVNDEMKLILAKLFNIKIRNLSNMNLFTNFEIYKQRDFKEIISLLEDNWISSYMIIFNKNSNSIINENKNLIKGIEYIIPKYKVIQNNNNDNAEDFNVKIQLYLKAIFNKKYGSKYLDFVTNKKLISKILKYIYISKETTISFKLQNKEK